VRLVLLLCLLAACGDSDPLADAGTPRDDAGLVDAGAPEDAATDAGDEADGGPGDAGAHEDAGPTGVACDDTLEEVYAADAGDGERGEVVACASFGSASAAELTEVIPDTVEAISGHDAVLFAYRTERREGVMGTGTALLFVPTAPREDAPLVAANHGTAGLADRCAPSANLGGDPQLALPWVAVGAPVVAVDYAGLGNAGVQGYANGYDTARSVLDGVRGALAILGEARPVVLTGHSQGGGATLQAQGLVSSYAPELDVRWAIPFSGGTTEPPELTPLSVGFLGNISLTGGLGVTRAATALALYADYANLVSEERAGEVFHEDLREHVVSAIESECIFELTATLATNDADVGYVRPDRVRDLVAPEFLEGVIACVREEPECTPEAQAWVDQDTWVPIDGDGAPVLFLTGDSDLQHTPASHACVRDYVEAEGVDTSVCFLEDTTHFDIVPKAIATAIEWVFEGTLSCPPEARPPTCD